MSTASGVSAARRMYWIGVGKGGVAKSMVAKATLDYLLEKGASVVLVDSDHVKPDLCKTYRTVIPNELVNINELNGWVRLGNFCGANRQAVIVVNTAPNNGEAVRRYRGTLDCPPDESQR